MLSILSSQQTDSTWGARILDLIDTTTEDEREKMSFPEGWCERPIWVQP